jgi:pre-mRNA-splicing factor CWC22
LIDQSKKMAAVYEEIPQFRSSTREDEDDVNIESHRAPIRDDNQDEDDDDREEEGEMKDEENQLPPPPQTRTMMDKRTDPMATRNMDLEPVRAAGRTTAVYIPPAKRKRLQQQQQQQLLQLEDGGGPESDHPSSISRLVGLQQQEETWRDQQRVIHGTINRLNAQTIKPLIQELFLKVNLIRMRGVLCKSTLAAALSSPKYSNVYAALISVVNSKLPEVGELVVNRSILAFRRHYQRREKGQCQAVCVFLAHLFHQAVVHELLILQLLSLLLDGDATDDSVEVAVEFLQTTGHALLEVSPAGVRACVDRVRSLLSEGQLNKRVQHKMEQLLKMRKNGFREFPPMAPELDLVERDDQITHETTLDDEELQKEEHLDTFQENPDYEELEKEWAGIRAEILGEEDDNDSHSSGSSDDDDIDDGSIESGDGNDNDGNSEPSVVPDQELATTSQSKVLTVIQDLTEEDLIHLRRTIYLTIMSSATFEECAHKLARIEIPAGREMELVNMLIECCSQERTFLRYYGLIASRFCLMADRWRETFMESFREQYTTIHRLETNKLRNVAKLFAHVLHTDAIPWSVLEIIHLNEDETTSSSRIFIKIVIQEMAEAMGIAKLKARLESVDGEGQVWYAGMFPKDNVRNTRYAINFFTSIGLGPLTDDLREFLKNAPKLILAKAKEAALAKKGDDSDSSSVTSSSSSSSSGTSSSTSSSGSSSSGSRSSFSSQSSSSGSRSSNSSSSSSYTSYSSRPRKNSSKRRGGGRRSRSYSSSSSSTTSNHNGDSRRRRAGKGDRKQRRDSPSRSASPPQEVVTRDDATSDVLNKKGEGQRSQKANSRSSTRGRSRSPSLEKRKRRRSPSSSRSRSESRSQSFRGEPSRRREEGDVGRKSPVDEPKGRSKRHRRRHSSSSSSSRSRSSGSDSRH